MRAKACMHADVVSLQIFGCTLPSVDVTMSTLCSTLKCSGVPRPKGPTKPVAWHSSTNTSASYLGGGGGGD